VQCTPLPLQFPLASFLKKREGPAQTWRQAFDPIGSFFSYKGLVVCSRVVFRAKLQKQGASSSRYIRQRQAFPKMYLGCRPTGDHWLVNRRNLSLTIHYCVPSLRVRRSGVLASRPPHLPSLRYLLNGPLPSPPISSSRPGFNTILFQTLFFSCYCLL
jgi:hypothetical protein